MKSITERMQGLLGEAKEQSLATFYGTAEKQFFDAVAKVIKGRSGSKLDCKAQVGTSGLTASLSVEGVNQSDLEVSAYVSVDVRNFDATITGGFEVADQKGSKAETMEQKVGLLTPELVADWVLEKLGFLKESVSEATAKLSPSEEAAAEKIAKQYNGDLDVSEGDVRDDIALAKSKGKKALLKKCLNGAEGEYVDAWKEYVSDVVSSLD